MYNTRSYPLKKTAASVPNVPGAPADSVSDIVFNPAGTHMAVASWDATIRLYRVPQASPSAYAPAQPFVLEKTISLHAPAISAGFFGDAMLAGLSDGTLVVIDPSGGTNTLRAHTAGIKRIRCFNNQLVITGSFDCTVRFWDFKSAAPVYTLTLPAKVYSMELKDAVLAVILADKTLVTYNMNDISHPNVIPLRFTYSLRSLAIASDGDTIAVGGIESRINVVSRTNESRRTVFRNHRINSRLYSVNTVRFPPGMDTLVVSGGADGTLVAFDKNSHAKICCVECPAAVTAVEFTPDGRSCVFAYGDDWSKGFTNTAVEVGLKVIDAKELCYSK